MERESGVAQAGRPGAVTIATNMAGRGTDIILAVIVTIWHALISKTLKYKLVRPEDPNLKPFLKIRIILLALITIVINFFY